MELRAPFTSFAKVFFQFQAALDHIFGKEIWRLHRTYHFGVSYEPYECQNLLIKGNWRPSKRVLLRNSSCGLYFSAQKFKGPSSHPELAFKLIDRICRQNIFIKNLDFCEDRASYRLQPPPG